MQIVKVVFRGQILDKRYLISLLSLGLDVTEYVRSTRMLACCRTPAEDKYPALRSSVVCLPAEPSLALILLRSSATTTLSQIYDAAVICYTSVILRFCLYFTSDIVSTHSSAIFTLLL